METIRTYYQDSYLKTTNVKISERRTHEKGVWLLPDRTIAYPGGGGQLPDIVTFNQIKVLEVKDEGDKLWYLLPADMNSAWRTMKMRIDWPWRYYNMQQHTGQHLLSAVLKEAGYDTVSVHLGEEYTLVEVSGPEPYEDLLQEIEKDSNGMIRKALEVKSFWIKPEEAANYPLRRPPKDWNRLRLVQIEGLDYAACGGTHVRNTAEIGYIKVSGFEKIRGHFRVKAFIGDRADRYFSQLHQIHLHLKSMLQADEASMTDRIEGLLEERSKYQRLAEKLKMYYLQVKADELIQNSRLSNGIVYYLLEPDEEHYAEDLARLLAHKKGIPACILSYNRLYFIAPDESTFNPNAFLKQHGGTLGIKGGGPRGFIQGIYDPERRSDLRSTLELL